MERRSFIARSLAGRALLGSGLLSMKDAMAEWPAAMHEKDITKALTALLGGAGEVSADIKIKAPEVAENGAVVPVDVDASALGNVENITIIVEKNSTPIAASFNFAKGTTGFVATRVKMGKSSNIIAVVKAGGKVYKAHKEVKVTIGGCGG